MKDKLINLLITAKKHYITLIIALIAIISVGTSAYLFTQIKSQKNTISNLYASLATQVENNATKDKKIASLQLNFNVLKLSNEKLTDVATELKLNNELFEESIVALATGVDELDNLLVSDDDKNRTLISWLNDNSQFYIQDGTLSTANTKIKTWKEYMAWSDTEYKSIKATIKKSLDDIKFRQDLLNQAVQEIQNEKAKQNI